MFLMYVFEQYVFEHNALRPHPPEAVSGPPVELFVKVLVCGGRGRLVCVHPAVPQRQQKDPHHHVAHVRAARRSVPACNTPDGRGGMRRVTPQ
eukprot:1020552-Pyramimonas_sp.AAC.1